MCHEYITNVLNTIYKYNFRLLFYPTLEIADIIKQNKKKTEETLYISKTILCTFPSLSKFQIDFTAGWSAKKQKRNNNFSLRHFHARVTGRSKILILNFFIVITISPSYTISRSPVFPWRGK